MRCQSVTQGSGEGETRESCQELLQWTVAGFFTWSAHSLRGPCRKIISKNAEFKEAADVFSHARPLRITVSASIQKISLFTVPVRPREPTSV